MKHGYQYGVTVAYFLMLAINGLANAIPINGQTTGAISDRYSNLFAPAGITFAIWGLIYIALGFYVFMVWYDDSEATNIKRQQLFIVSAFLNASWLISFHYDLIGLSVILMIGLLVTLILLVLQIDHEAKVTSVIFQLYLGWITVATIANITIFLVSLNLTFLRSLDLWTILVLWIGVVVALLAAYRLKSMTYLLTLSWAYLGIYIKHQTVYLNTYSNIMTAVIGGLVVFFAMMGYLIYSDLKLKNNRPHA